jgi:bacillithiol biosynthesis cysteine-adding enzyme BshC
VLVVAGQQPGLLGGPLLSLHKAAGALALADRLRRASGAPVVAAFWIASDDHDWDEVNRAVVRCRDGGLRALSLSVPSSLHSVRHVEVPEEATRALLDDLAACLPPTERAAEALSLFARPPSADVARWFAAVLTRLLGETGLVLLDPEVLAPFSGETLARLARDAPRVAHAIEEGARRLSAEGLSPPLDVDARSTALFLRDGPRGRRLRVRVADDGEGVLLRGEPTSLSLPALAQRLRAQPELGSGDVVGRVLVQNALLPVLVQVGGPAELLYLAQARPAHDALGISFPCAAPRPQATWVEDRVERDLQAFGLTAADVLEGKEPRAAPRESGTLSAEAGSIRDRIASLAERSEDGPSRRVLDALAGQAGKAAERLADLEEERLGRGRARLERARAALLPRGRPQERVLSPVSLVARHGVMALREGLGAMDPLAPGHHLVRV